MTRLRRRREPAMGDGPAETLPCYSTPRSASRRRAASSEKTTASEVVRERCAATSRSADGFTGRRRLSKRGVRRADFDGGPLTSGHRV